MTKAPKDLGASMQARLRNLARQRGEDVQGLLMQFVLERLLHRLAASAHAGDFVLKGAMLFAAWTSTPHRATRDLDLHGTGSPSRERLVEVFRAVAATAVEPDGVTFLAATVRASRIRDDQPYQGIRVTLTAVMATARIGVQVDVGFGDAVHPAPVKLQYPSLLGLPTPRLRAYPREAVVAEKFHAMVALGVCVTEGHAARHASSRLEARRRSSANRPIRLRSSASPQPRIHAPDRRASRDADS